MDGEADVDGKNGNQAEAGQVVVEEALADAEGGDAEGAKAGGQRQEVGEEVPAEVPLPLRQRVVEVGNVVEVVLQVDLHVARVGGRWREAMQGWVADASGTVHQTVVNAFLLLSLDHWLRGGGGVVGRAAAQKSFGVFLLQDTPLSNEVPVGLGIEQDEARVVDDGP